MNRPAFSLLETMRWTPDNGIALRAAHMARLAAAAAFFGYPFEPALVHRVLEDAIGSCEAAARVRLTLDAGGTPTVEVTPLDSAGPGRPWRVALYPEPVEAGGPFWRHKTTYRPHYDTPYAWARSHGLDDALLAGPGGDLVEATRATVWIERGGRLWTPPLTSGGLPGVYRGHLLATRPEAGEAPLRVGDLDPATGLLLSNAVHGLVRAEWVAV